jgi:hypothetical protein
MLNRHSALYLAQSMVTAFTPRVLQRQHFLLEAEVLLQQLLDLRVVGLLFDANQILAIRQIGAKR